MEKRSASLLLQSTTVSPPDPGPEAAIAVLRMGKLEWVVEKGTELGASAFLFYTADRSEKETVTATQIARLRLIAIAALKQSGRLHLPRFEFHPCLDPLLVSLLPCLFGDLDPEAPPLEPSAPTVRFFTGPEKGFSERELGLLQARARGVRLGQYVLRAETAPIAALARLYRT
jgi:16S rRNA (uracil1498-N3)-methyltransferase